MKNAKCKIQNTNVGTATKIDAKGIYYKELNARVREILMDGGQEITIENVNGQRYIGNGLSADARIIIHGTPGNDLGAFMNGTTLEVFGNAQDGTGNTMNAGKIIIHGDAGDIAGHAMRGGKVYILGDAGYRAGIHMKAYQDLNPVIIVGGCAQDFLGEYMAGGVIIILGLHQNPEQSIVGKYCGTGMHGGTIYIRGDVEDHQLGREVKVFKLDDKDQKDLETYIGEYSLDLSIDLKEIRRSEFCKLIPYTHRPYGKLYAY